MPKLSPKLLLLVAGTLSLCTAALLYFYLQEDDAPAESKVRTVVIAAQDIPARAKIAPEMVREMTVSAEAVQQDALTEASKVIGRATKLPVFAGEQIGENRLARPGEGGMAGAIPPDKRAYTFAINDISGVAGFVQPGDFVDVVAAMQKGETNNVVSKVVLQDVQVLAVGRSDKPDESGKPQEKLESVTLAVSLDEAERIASLQGRATLALALRPFDARGTQIALGRELVEIMGYGVLARASAPAQPQGPLAVPPPAAAVEPQVQAEGASPAQPQEGIVIYRGTTKEIVPVKR